MPSPDSAIAVLLTAASLLLVLAGTFKILRPAATTPALLTTGLPATPVAVLLLGVIEIGIGISHLAIGNRATALAVGLVHLAFAVFAGRLRRADPSAPCGCFGRTTPVSALHVGVNAYVGALGSIGALVDAGTRSMLTASPWPAPPTGVAIVLTAALLHTAFTAPGAAEPAPSPAPAPIDRDHPSTIDGRPVTDPTAIRSTPVAGERDLIVVFLSTTCLVCRTIWSDLGRRRRRALPAGVRLVIVVDGADDATRATELAPSGVDTLLVDDVHESWAVPGDPWAILLDGRTGAVRAEGTGSDWPEIRSRLFGG